MARLHARKQWGQPTGRQAAGRQAAGSAETKGSWFGGPLASRQKSKLRVPLMLTGLTAGIGIAMPFATALMASQALASGVTMSAQLLYMAATATQIGVGCLGASAAWHQVRTRFRVEAWRQLRMHLARVPLSVVEKHASGISQSREDLDAVENGVGELQPVINGWITLLGGTGAALVLFPPVGLVLGGVAALQYVALTAIKRTRGAAEAETEAAKRDLEAERSDDLDVSSIVHGRLSTLDGLYDDRRLGIVERFMRAAKKSIFLNEAVATVTAVIGATAALVLCATAGGLSGIALLGGLAYIAAASFSITAIARQGSITAKLKQRVTAVDHLLSLERTTLGDIGPERVRHGGVRMQNADFRPPDSRFRTLHDFSTEMAEGDVVYVVGKNGAGKSTLAKLLMGLYSPASGDSAVQLGGQPTARLSPLARQERMACALSGAPMVNDRRSIIDVLLDGRARTPENEAGVLRVCDRLQLEHAIDDSGGLYDTAAGWYSRMSAGQRDRILLARALAKQDARLMVLDEVDAHLDGVTRRNVLDQTLALAAERGTTTVIITQHPSSIPDNGRVLVLSSGALVADDLAGAMRARPTSLFAWLDEADRANQQPHDAADRTSDPKPMSRGHTRSGSTESAMPRPMASRRVAPILGREFASAMNR